MESVRETQIALLREEMQDEKQRTEYLKILDMFFAGSSILEIAATIDANPTRVCARLENLHNGEWIDATQLVKDTVHPTILEKGTKWFRDTGNLRLTDAQSETGIDYATLRLCRINSGLFQREYITWEGARGVL